MKVSKSVAYTYCRSGRYGGQIPLVYLNLGGGPTLSDDVDLPDEWFIFTLSSGLPTTENKGSFMYWSRRGLRENRAELQRQFKTEPGYRTGEQHDYGLTFEQWLQLCEEDNRRIDETVLKTQRAAQNKLNQLSTYTNK